MAAPKGNDYNLIYTKEIALDLFAQAKEILENDPEILTDSMLQVKCKYALNLPISTYRYLRDEKYPKDLADIKTEIDTILESRVMKSKEMYPGIAAMTLKNKHKWRDQVDTLQVPAKVEDVSDELKARIIANVKSSSAEQVEHE